MRLRSCIEALLSLFVFLLPWQTRFLVHTGELSGGYWEYGTISIYATDVVFGMLFFAFCVWMLREKKWKETLSLLATKALLWYVFFIFWGVLISFTALIPSLSFYHLLRVTEFFACIVILALFPISYKKIFLFFVMGALIQSVIAIVEFCFFVTLESKWLGTSAHYAWQLGDAVVETDTARFLRSYAAFPHPNILGGYLFLAIIFCMGLYHDMVSSLKKHSTCLIAVILSAGLFFSFSRSAWLALVFGCFILISLARSTLRRLLPPLFGVVLTFIALGFLYSDLVATRVLASGRLESISLEQRNDAYHDQRLIAAHWFLGVGFGNATYALWNQNPTLPSYAYQPPHNTFLLTTLETGIVGAYFLIQFFVEIFMGTLRSLRKQRDPMMMVALTALIGLIIISFLDHYLWTLPVGMIMLGIPVGMLIRAWRNGRPILIL